MLPEILFTIGVFFTGAPHPPGPIERTLSRFAVHVSDLDEPRPARVLRLRRYAHGIYRAAAKYPGPWGRRRTAQLLLTIGRHESYFSEATCEAFDRESEQTAIAVGCFQAHVAEKGESFEDDAERAAKHLAGAGFACNGNEECAICMYATGRHKAAGACGWSGLQARLDTLEAIANNWARP